MVIKMTMVKSPNTVMTSGISAMIDECPQVGMEIQECLLRHMLGDWGEVCEEDRQQNDEAAEHMGYILSAYTVKNTKIWIITDYGWDVTTILLPEEY